MWTVNVVWDSDPLPEDKLNVYFYTTGKNGEYTNIKIPDSLSVSDEYKMLAVAEVITQNSNYSEEKFGTKEHIESSKELDIRQVGNTLKRQDVIYAMLEFAVSKE